MAELALESVVKRFGTTTAVDGVSMTVPHGETLVLLGASGCGKTTLLRMIAGFTSPDAGTIRIDGETVASANHSVPPERRGLSMVFQSYAVWPHKTVGENLAYGLRLRKLDRKTIGEHIERALALVKMQGYADRYPGELSGGQQQRVALARALVLEPAILLFDEPLSNLDATLREHMRFEIKGLLAKLRITSVYVTHDQQEAMVIGDRVAVMNHGRIEQLGTPEEIYCHSRTHFVASFVGMANLLDGTLRDIGHDGFTVAAGTLGDVRVDVTRNGVPHVPGPVKVCVRPEHIALSRERPQTDNVLHGRVARRTFLGATTDYSIDANGVTIRVIAVGSGPYIAGDEIYLGFSALDCQLLEVPV